MSQKRRAWSRAGAKTPAGFLGALESWQGFKQELLASGFRKEKRRAWSRVAPGRDCCVDPRMNDPAKQRAVETKWGPLRSDWCSTFTGQAVN